MSVLYSTFSALTTKQASIKEKLSVTKSDIEDTINNQSALLSDLLDIADAMDPCHALYEYTGTNGDIYFEMDGYQYCLRRDAEIREVDLYRILPSDEIYVDWVADEALHIMNTEVRIDDFTYEDFIGHLQSYISDSISSTNIVNSLIDVSLMSDNNAEILNKFANLTSSASGVSSAASKTRDNILSYLTLVDNSAAGALSIISDLYSSLGSLSMEQDGAYTFNDTNFYVQGFAGSYFVSSLVQFGSTIISTILTAINPALGAIAFIGSTAISALVNLFTEVSDSNCILNLSDDMYLYAQPILQISEDLTWWRNSYSYREEFYQEMKDQGGIAVIRHPWGAIILWANDKGNTINAEWYVSVIGNHTNNQDVFSYDIQTLVDQNQYIRVIPKVLDDSNNRRDMNGQAVCYYRQYLNEKYYYDNLQSSVAGITEVNNITDENIRGNIASNIWQLTAYVQSCTGAQSIGPMFDPVYNKLTTFGYGAWIDSNIPGWSDIVHNLVPDVKESTFYTSIRNCFLALDSFVYNTGTDDSTWTNFLGIKAIINNDFAGATSMNHSYATGYTFNRGAMFAIPPKYSPAALGRTIGIILGLAAATTVAIVAVNKVKVKIRKSMSKRYLDVTAKQNTYVEALRNGTATQEMYDDYYKAIKKYNLIAGFTGYSKLSFTSGWEIGSDDAAGLVGTISQLNSDKISTIQGSNAESNVTTLSAAVDNLQEAIAVLKSLIKAD